MTAFQAAMGVFYPILLLSGIVWPVQGMPTALRYISYALPQTYACDSIRAILYRGWDLSYLEVYLGYIITVVWMILHVSLSVLVLKIKH
ncbi:ABC-2 type transporter [Trinorchestia longiramus]|nr:ABC-2 type transporter [Trinorchestia longiramus]